ncbi:rhodopsin [Fasciolopsis buskii]|uniref:Rhodopsin n=1 Tax=Fasciolopsis buskii TaxID=27845 RepID=A0A8E0RKJ8_9TREM|nr:rhodopsin [Fasciolopsis buski]
MSSYTLFDAHTGTNRTYGTMWSTDTEFASWVHPHWRKFSPPDPIYNYLVGIYVGLMGLTGIVGNLITVILFFACEKLRSPSNVLIINLAISDLSFAAINGFPLKTMSAFNQQWTWGKKGSYIPEGFHTSCTFDYLSVDLGNLLFNSGMYFFAFLCPVAVIIFSYAGIVKAVYESEALEDLSSSRRHRCSQPETAQSKLTVDMLTHN